MTPVELRELRAKAGVTARKLAEMARGTPQHGELTAYSILQYEDGIGRIALPYLLKMEEVLRKLAMRGDSPNGKLLGA